MLFSWTISKLESSILYLSLSGAMYLYGDAVMDATSWGLKWGEWPVLPARSAGWWGETLLRSLVLNYSVVPNRSTGFFLTDDSTLLSFIGYIVAILLLIWWPRRFLLLNAVYAFPSFDPFESSVRPYIDF